MGLLDFAFGGAKRGEKLPPEEAALVAEIIERVMNATDKRLANVSSCEKKLHDPALATFKHLRDIVRAIPGPVEMSAAAWTAGPPVRALFAKPEEIGAAFGNSADLAEFLAKNPVPECLAIAGFETVDRKVLAPAMQGEMVQRDVERTTISFGHPRVIAPGHEMRDVRIALGMRAIDHLAMLALQRITALHGEKEELEKERALLKYRLQLAAKAGRGLTGLSEAEGTKHPDPAEVRKALEKNQEELAKRSPLGLMDRLVSILSEVLSAPADFIRLETRTVTLDAMNYVVKPDTPGSLSLDLSEIHVAEKGRFAAFIAKIPRSELPADDRWTRAAKLL